MTATIKTKRQRRKLGNLLAIPSINGDIYFGRELREGVVAIYDLRSREILKPKDIVGTHILFSVAVMNYAITKSRWIIIGWEPLEPSLAKPIDFFIQDQRTGKFSIYKEGGAIVPATREEIGGLECAAGWEPEHVEDRVRDHYAGRKNVWFESLKPK